jgi:rare lipoprotein A
MARRLAVPTRRLLASLVLLASLGALQGVALAAKGPRITLVKITPDHIVQGQQVTVSGEVSRAVDADEIIIQEWREAHWWTVKRADLNYRRFSATFTPKETGSGVVRALIPGSHGRGQYIAVLTVFKEAEATWYGPGFYGNSTACGQTYNDTILGVAHRTLPCGTAVTLFFNGVVLTVPVIDRGPYSTADWDLSAETARRLGFSGRQNLGFLIAVEPGE